jgi:hypothetical protein
MVNQAYDVNAQIEADVKTKLQKKAKAFKVVKIIVASLLIAMGIILFYIGFDEIYYSSNYTSYETYGGDAYTGIQNAAADTARNVDNLGDLIEESTEIFFMFTGIIVVLVGVLLLLKYIEQPAVVNKEILDTLIEDAKAKYGYNQQMMNGYAPMNGQPPMYGNNQFPPQQ